MILEGGPNIYGIPIGILSLDSNFAKVPGHIKNATTFYFPVTYKIIKDARIPELMGQPDRSLLEPFIEAARELVRQEGVRAITGSCGFLAVFQKEIADAVDVPVFISSLIQVPIVYHMLRSDQRVGVMVATKSGLTQEHLSAVGADNVPMCIAGMDGQKEFCEVIMKQNKQQLAITKLEKEVTSVAVSLVRENPDVGAIVLECTDMPPFAHHIQKAVNLPVFDLITLTNMVYNAVARKS
jgi:Asp/Glu/hydantoin racemase